MPKKLTQEEFLAKAVAVHGVGRYDYTETVYLPMPQKIAIRCPRHGVSMQKAGQHLFGKGCLLCANQFKYLKGNEARRIWDTEKVRDVARRIHPNLEFGSFIFNGYEKFSIVSCSLHGAFFSSAHYLLAGRGCPTCSKDKKGLNWIARVGDRPATLYLIRIFGGGENFYKIGITTGTIHRRYKSARDMPEVYQYEILAQHQSTDAARIYDWEQSILETFAHLRYHPKRSFGGETECFSSCEEILAIFPL